MTHDYDCTAVVCTLGSRPLLETSIPALLEQSLSGTRYEILVVDNSRDERLLPFLRALCEGCPRADPPALRLIDCPALGLSNARNRAIDEARGELLCFLDDDSLAAPDLLEWILAAFGEHDRLGVLGGAVELEIGSYPPPWLAKRLWCYWSHFAPSRNAFYLVDETGPYPVGANWSARRLALREIEGFCTDFGRKGRDFGGGEEIHAAAALRKRGWQVGIEPRARVRHVVSRQRFTIEHLCRTIEATTVSTYRLQVAGLLPRPFGSPYVPWFRSLLVRGWRELALFLHRTERRRVAAIVARQVSRAYFDLVREP